jgi:hypothetical protein
MLYFNNLIMNSQPLFSVCTSTATPKLLQTAAPNYPRYKVLQSQKKIIFRPYCWGLQPRVETKMHFSVFAKMRKLCENGQIFAKFHEISFLENISFSRKFSRKYRIIFAKIFAKTKNSDFRENIRENIVKFSRKRKTRIFAKIFAKMSWNFCENFRGNEKRRKCSQKSRNIFEKTKTQIFAKIVAKLSFIF